MVAVVVSGCCCGRMYELAWHYAVVLAGFVVGSEDFDVDRDESRSVLLFVWLSCCYAQLNQLCLWFAMFVVVVVAAAAAAAGIRVGVGVAVDIGAASADSDCCLCMCVCVSVNTCYLQDDAACAASAAHFQEQLEASTCFSFHRLHKFHVAETRGGEGGDCDGCETTVRLLPSQGHS